MKISKTELKSIVKECLIEILNEGLGSSVQPQNIQRKIERVDTRSNFQESSRRHRQQQTASSEMQRSREAVKLAAAGNPIMESILSDTAVNSLPKMMQHDVPMMLEQARMTGGSVGMPPALSADGTVEKIVSSHTPEDLFGEEVSSKWADLAFASVPTK